MPSRQDQHRTTLSVDGVYLGAWESKTGGDSDSNSVQWQLAGMGGQISLGGSRMTANVVLARLQTDEIQGRRKWLRSRAGRGVSVVTEQPLDDEGFAHGDPDIYLGILKRVKPSDRNSNANNPAEIEVEIEVNGVG